LGATAGGLDAGGGLRTSEGTSTAGGKLVASSDCIEELDGGITLPFYRPTIRASLRRRFFHR